MIESRAEVEPGARSLDIRQRWCTFGDCSSGIAHEFRSPLQALSYNFDFLREADGDHRRLHALAERMAARLRERGEDERLLAEWDEACAEADVEFLAEEVPRALDRGEQSVQDVSELVDALRIYLGPAPKPGAPLDLSEQVSLSLRLARNEWKYDLEIDFEPAELPLVAGPGDRLLHSLVLTWMHLGRRAAARRGSGGGAKLEVRCGERSSGLEVALVAAGFGGEVLGEAERRALTEAAGAGLEWSWEEGAEGRARGSLLLCRRREGLPVPVEPEGA